jgi:predicted dehydrogenase
MLREILDRGGLGRILGARASVHWIRDAAYYARRDWRGRWATAGGGVLMNQAIHTLDLLQWFVGPVTDVRGTVATLALPALHRGGGHRRPAAAAPHRTADTVSSGLLRHQRPRRERPVDLEIITEHARLRLDTDLTVAHDDGRVETFRPGHRGVGRRAYWGASHGLLIEDFYRHVRAGKRFWIDAPAALESLRVIQAVYDRRRARWTADPLDSGHPRREDVAHRSRSGGTATMSEDPARDSPQIRRIVQPPRPFRPG